MKAGKIQKMTICALLVALNIIGAYLALSLKLPIYLDSIGTMLAALLFGAPYALLTAVTAGMISAITADYYAFFFIPAALVVAMMTAFAKKKALLSGWKLLWGVFLITIFATIIASIIAAYLFGGVTSSGSSYLAQYLHGRGLNLVLSVFITQFFTDYLDKLISLIIALKIATTYKGKGKY